MAECIHLKAHIIEEVKVNPEVITNVSTSSSPIHLPLKDKDADLDLHEETDALPTNITVSDPFLWPKQLSDLELTSVVQKGPVSLQQILPQK